LHDLLIAGVSAGSSSQSHFLHMSGLRRTPFFHSNDLFGLLVLIWLLRGAGGHNFCLAACQKQLGRFREVLTDMEPIRDLNGLGSPLRSGFGILASAISTHHRDFWVLSHPLGSGFCLPIR
jgi:hypothetical protein